MSTPSRWVFFRRVLAGRCPQCDRGALFARFARLNTQCPECGLVYRRESGSQTGAMYLSAAVTEIVAALTALALFFFTDWSTPVALTVGVVVVVGFCYAFLPRSMALWVAIEYATDVGNGEVWVRDAAAQSAAARESADPTHSKSVSKP